MTEVIVGIGAAVLYGIMGIVVAVGLGRVFLPVRDRRKIVEHRAGAGLWISFGTIWALWPLGLLIAALVGAIYGAAKCVAAVAAYAFDVLDPGQECS